MSRAALMERPAKPCLWLPGWEERPPGKTEQRAQAWKGRVPWYATESLQVVKKAGVSSWSFRGARILPLSQEKSMGWGLEVLKCHTSKQVQASKENK